MSLTLHCLLTFYLSLSFLLLRFLVTDFAGCGKRTIVRFVARRLGLHVVEFSCNSLMSSSERKTSIALAEAFNTAQRYQSNFLSCFFFLFMLVHKMNQSITMSKGRALPSTFYYFWVLFTFYGEKGSSFLSESLLLPFVDIHHQYFSSATLMPFGIWDLMKVYQMIKMASLPNLHQS